MGLLKASKREREREVFFFFWNFEVSDDLRLMELIEHYDRTKQSILFAKNNFMKKQPRKFEKICKKKKK